MYMALTQTTKMILEEQNDLTTFRIFSNDPN